MENQIYTFIEEDFQNETQLVKSIKNQLPTNINIQKIHGLKVSHKDPNKWFAKVSYNGPLGSTHWDYFNIDKNLIQL